MLARKFIRNAKNQPVKTIVKLIHRHRLSPIQMEQMWSIYKEYYNCSKVSFMERITLNNLYALYVKDGLIRGFTGLRINHIEVEGKKKFLIYFGQTIVPWGLKGRELFPKTTAKLLLKYWKEALFTETWAWYDALTFKAYMIPAKTVPSFYPNCRTATPPLVKKLMDHIGKHYYGENYCERTGTISKPMPFVKTTYRKIGDELLINKDVAFFAASNPRYEEGHGLLTCVPLHVKNLIVIIRPFWKKGLAGRKASTMRQSLTLQAASRCK